MPKFYVEPTRLELERLFDVPWVVIAHIAEQLGIEDVPGPRA
ncbi:hypothetical protein [Streptomyces longisporoflavus]|uniref:Transposase n=1 Tax=Streptomyces longisporoflavus TaxID=28044 RepID=A0ABW7R0J2_9ACTN